MSLRAPAYVLLMLAAVLAIAGEWAPAAVGASAWKLPLAVLLLGLAWERFESARLPLRVALRAPPQWRLGRSEALLLELQAGGSRRRAMEIAVTLPQGLALESAPVVALHGGRGTPAEASLRATARRLGRWSWPVQPVRVAGLFGLAGWTRQVAPEGGLRVVPDALRPVERLRGLAVHGQRGSLRVAASGQADQLRDYRPGDPPRIVDWKATARRGAMTSREFVEEQHVDVILAVDVGRSSALRCEGLERLGHYVNTAARFAELALARDDRVGLVAYAAQPLAVVPPMRGGPALARVRETLGSLAAQAGEGNPLPAVARILALARHRSLVVLLTDVEDAASAGQLATAVRLLQRRHLPLVAGLAGRALGEAAQLPAGRWLDPYVALAAQFAEAQRSRAVRAFAALGTPALVASPARLEAEVLARYEEFRARRRV